MGGTQSQSISDYVQNNLTYTQIISTALTVQANTFNNVNNVNGFKFAQGTTAECGPGGYGTLDCHNWTVNNTIQNDEYIVSSISSQVAQQLSSQLQFTAQNDIQQALAQLQKGSLGGSQVQKAGTDLINSLSETLNSSTVENLVNNVISSTVNTNNTTIYNCGLIEGYNCKFDNTIVNRIVIQNILTSLTSNVSQSTAAVNFNNALKTAMSQTQQGLIDDLLSAIGNFFKSFGEIGLGLIIGGVLLFFFLIVLVIWIL